MDKVKGVLFIGDLHLSHKTIGFRKDDYSEAILDKFFWSLNYAEKKNLIPVVLGDFFHYPKDNANWLISRLLETIKAPILGIYGNHDCHQNQLDDDDSLMILKKANKVILIDEDTPFQFESSNRKIIIGGTSWNKPLIKSYFKDLNENPLVFWVTHHNIAFNEFTNFGYIEPYEICGVDLVVNGHLHRPQDEVRKGNTLWVNPGSLARVSRGKKKRCVHLLEVMVNDKSYSYHSIEVPIRPYKDVFFESKHIDNGTSSSFITGVKELESMKTMTSEGFKQFLIKNLDQFDEEVKNEILLLANEVLKDDKINI